MTARKGDAPTSQIAKDWDDAQLINAAYEIHEGAPEFYYRLVADELHEQDITAGRVGWPVPLVGLRPHPG